MDLRQLSYVVAVVDEGSFTAAAEAMHVAQPSLSQTVRNLERELGVDLFHRTPRAVVLTDAGRALLEPARQALRDADIAKAAVRAVVGLTSGSVDLVCLPTLAVHPAAELIGRFRRAYSQLTVHMVEPEDAGDVAARVMSGASEIGLAELPVGEAALVEVELERHDYVAVMPARIDDHGPQKDRISIRALARLPLITSPSGTSSRRQIDDAFAAANVEASIAVEADHREAFGPLVSAGAGIAVLPRRVADSLDQSEVTIATITPRIVRRIGIIHRTGTLSPAAAAFLEIALGQRGAR